MERYAELAGELFSVLDHGTRRPHHDEASAAMRGEMAVMRLLDRQNGELTAGEISRLLEMTTSRIAAVLGSLQKKGLILRKPDEQDRRRVLVTLTDSGRMLCRKREQRVIDYMTGFLRSLGEEDAAHFVRLMKRAQEILPPPPLCADEEEQKTDEGGRL